jgi:hypothetical protein
VDGVDELVEFVRELVGSVLVGVGGLRRYRRRGCVDIDVGLNSGGCWRDASALSSTSTSTLVVGGRIFFFVTRAAKAAKKRPWVSVEIRSNLLQVLQLLYSLYSDMEVGGRK